MNPINISLLPLDYKREKQLNRKFRISTIAMFIIVGVLVFTYLILQILSTVPKAELKVLQSESNTYDTEINSLMKYNDLADRIQNVYTYAKIATDDQPDWLGLFIAISETVPEGMQINEVSTSITDNGTTSISINGIAKNHEMTALWVQDLKQKEEFTDANIEFSHTLSTGTTEFGLNLVYNKDIIFDLFEEVE
jgi:Tfp pilus assembly protein PilN